MGRERQRGRGGEEERGSREEGRGRRERAGVEGEVGGKKEGLRQWQGAGVGEGREGRRWRGEAGNLVLEILNSILCSEYS